MGDRARSSRMLRASSSQNLMERDGGGRNNDPSTISRKLTSREKPDNAESSRVSLSASSYHGGPPGLGEGRSSGRVRRVPPSRTKSSDNPEMMSASSTGTARRADELGATTMHGTSVSRIRTQRGTLQRQPSRRESTTKGDRRPAMKRAMSTENVKRPEEYGPRGTSSSTPISMYGGRSEARRGRRHPTKTNDGELTAEVTDCDVEESTHNYSDDDDSFADEDGKDNVEKDAEDGVDRHGNEAVTRYTSPSHKTKSKPPRRELLVLLREQKTVVSNDFNDKDNRRILHFLLYQHKLGMDLSELQSNVTNDIAMHGTEAMRRPVLPLYVEPA